MQVQVADAGTLAKRVTISYTAAEVAERKAKLLKSLAGEVKMEGFRPGKAPKAVLEKRYGAAAQAQAEEALADEGVNSALKEHKLRPFGQIANEGIERKAGLSLTVAFETYPVVAIPDAKSLKVEAGDATVTDAEVDEFAGSIAKRLGEMSPLAADELVIEDDSVTLDGSLTVDGAEVRKLAQFNHLVGGYPLFGKQPKDVIAAFANAKVGSKIEFDTVLPANFTPAEQAGKTAHLAVTIASANRMRAAALDDALAQKVGAKDLAGLKETLKQRIASRKQGEVRGKQLEQLSAALLEKITVELPPKALAAAIARAEADAEAKAKEKNEDVAKAKAEAKANIEKAFKRHVIMVALGDHLDVQLTDDDFREQIMMAAQQTGRKPQDIADQLQKSGQGAQVAMEIREAKAMEQYLDQVLGTAQAAAKA
jgi:trigger factor